MPDVIGLLLVYGPALLFVVTVLAAFGLPAPASLSLIAAGAFTIFGHLSYPTVFAAGLVGTVLGDHLAYLLAARASQRVHRMKLVRHLARAEELLTRWGVIYVFFSRWVFPTVLTPATNYFAGLSRYPFRYFTPAVIAGEGIYVGGYMALGRVFSTQVPQINAFASQASLLIFLLIVAAIALAILVRSILRPKPGDRPIAKELIGKSLGN